MIDVVVVVAVVVVAVVVVVVAVVVVVVVSGTSVWSLFIYGVGSLGVEQLYRRFHTSLPLLLRGLCYVAWIYAWEFSTGECHV
ncbi:Transmembrane protein 229B [Portunus trituberculatus]|uniref:Transmembrane protein 229B n=1 Tax=Portunus trituberculatus TaxID=210409 RepID=A0A5B7FVE1_PORTR|nr:Transmembrane protein 229B [Portunus trituberculatus]